MTFPMVANSLALAQRPASLAEMERLRLMQFAWKAYRGKLQKPLKVEPDQPDDNVMSNRCAPIVDKGVSFLFGKVVKVEAPDETPKADTTIQDCINGLWGDDDDAMTLLSMLALNGGVCGQGFLKLIPPRPGMKYPRIIALDPQLIRVITDPDDVSVVLAYIIEYPVANGTQRRQIISRIDPDNLAGEYGNIDPDDTWQIATYVRSGVNPQQTAYTRIGEPEVWPYPFPPIFDCQNLPNPNEHWGTADLTEDLIQMNVELNFVQSNTARILKYHAHPKTFIKGAGASQVSVGVDEIIVLDSDSAEIGVIEMHSDMASSLNFAGVIRSDMDEQSRVPAVALGRLADLPKGNISGVALQLLFQPLLEKTQQKQRLYGRLIREVTRAALVIMGHITPADFEDYAIEVHWQNLLPVDDTAAAQTALILAQLGVSRPTILQQLGYDPDAEADKVAADDEAGHTAPISKPKPAPVVVGTPQNMPTTSPEGQQGDQLPEAA